MTKLSSSDSSSLPLAQPKYNFKLFLKKKIKFLGFHAKVLVKTSLMYELLMYLHWYRWSQSNFFSCSTETRRTYTLRTKFKFSCFHAVVPTCEDLSIDVSITNVRLILTKLWWFLFLRVKMDGQTYRQTRFCNLHEETSPSGGRGCIIRV